MRKLSFKNSKGEPHLVQEYIQEITVIGSMVRTSEKILQSRLFPVAKKGIMKKCMVLDMSRLNKFIPCKKFLWEGFTSRK